MGANARSADRAFAPNVTNNTAVSDANKFLFVCQKHDTNNTRHRKSGEPAGRVLSCFYQLFSVNSCSDQGINDLLQIGNIVLAFLCMKCAVMEWIYNIFVIIYDYLQAKLRVRVAGHDIIEGGYIVEGG